MRKLKSKLGASQLSFEIQRNIIAMLQDNPWLIFKSKYFRKPINLLTEWQKWDKKTDKKIAKIKEKAKKKFKKAFAKKHSK